MNDRRTYLDWNASEPLRPEAREAMLSALHEAGNPSSVHAEGRRARAIIETARTEVAALVGAREEDVYFTSGATEANAWVLCAGGWDAVFAASLEHDSVLRSIESSAARLVELPVGPSGAVGTEGLVKAAAFADAPFSGRGLLVLQLANNETGILQPVAEMVPLARAHGLSVMTDAAQAAGRIAIDVEALGADYVTLSAHKLGGPKGVGALVARPGARLAPLITGGGQESRQRAGTENVVGIAGFGAAAAASRAELSSAGERVGELRDRLEAGIAAATPEAVVIGADAPRLPNTTCVALPGRRAELLVAALDLAGIAVSAGAACSSGKVGRNRVLEAMGLDPEIADAAIRVSLGRTTTVEDVHAFLAAWRTVADRRRRAA